MSEIKREELLRRIGQTCFYLGLLLELVIVIIDKSAYTNPIQGQMFRVTFLLFAVKVACSRLHWKDWLYLAGFGLIAAVCYLYSDRDEAVRLVVFCAAFKDVDLKKALKLTFAVTLAGCLLLVALAVTGIFGNMYIVDEGDRGIRYCFGLGHPNAFFCMFWVLTVLGIYLYHAKMKWHTWVLLAAAGIAFYFPTNSRTGILIYLFTLVFAMLLLYGRKAGESRLICALGIAAVLFCTFLSVWIACYEPYQGPFYPYDRFFTGRITSMNTLEGGGGILRNWRLFSRPENVKYFDMGYVRLFYWYGVIPGAVYLAVYIWLMGQVWKRRDRMGFMMLTVFALYSMLEAHFISVYLGRNYALFLLGAYWTGRRDALPGAAVQEGYIWRLPGDLIQAVRGKRAG